MITASTSLKNINSLGETEGAKHSKSAVAMMPLPSNGSSQAQLFAQLNDQEAEALRKELHSKGSEMLGRLRNDMEQCMAEYEKAVCMVLSSRMRVPSYAPSFCARGSDEEDQASSMCTLPDMKSMSGGGPLLLQVCSVKPVIPKWLGEKQEVFGQNVPAVSSERGTPEFLCSAVSVSAPVDLHSHEVVEPGLNAGGSSGLQIPTSEVMFSGISDIFLSGENSEGLRPPKVYASRKLCELAGVRHEADVGKTWLEHFVKGAKFDALCCSSIIVCTLTMACEIQYFGYVSGYAMGVSSFNGPQIPAVADAFEFLEIIFSCFFVFELIARLWAMRMAALWSWWIRFDVVLVSLSWMDILGLLNFGADPVMLRIVRLARMMRLLKVFRSIRIFETLFLLVRSLQASRGALGWSFALVWCIQFAAALALCQLTAPFIADESVDEATRHRMYAYFGTFSQGMLTLFEITLGNWIVPCRFLMVSISEWYSVFFVLYRGCFMFAVVKVITAVFVSETMRCAASDDELAMQKKQKGTEAHCKKIGEVFRELDRTGSGFLCWEDFSELLADDMLKTWLSSMDIDTHDLSHLFKVLSNGGEDQISLDDLVVGMSRIKGPAKSIDVLKLLSNTSTLEAQLDLLLAEKMKDKERGSPDRCERQTTPLVKRSMTCLLK